MNMNDWNCDLFECDTFENEIMVFVYTFEVFSINSKLTFRYIMVSSC